MAINYWCKPCNVKVDNCYTGEEHKKDYLWRADICIGHQRLRKYFRTKELAQAYESGMRTDYLRGKLMPRETQSKIPFKEFSKIWFDKYVQMRVKNPGAERYHIESLCSYFKDRPLSDLKHGDGEAFIQDALKLGQKPGYINRKIHTLKSMMNWAVKNEYILVNPFLNVKQLKTDEGRVRWLTKEEVGILIDTCHRLKDPSLAQVIYFGLYTGFRKGNLKRVTIQDIHNGFITASKTKSGKPYDVPISEPLFALLSELIKDKVPGQPLLNTISLERRFRYMVKESGLWKGPKHPDTPTIHTLRHTFASWYIMQAGADIFRLQRMMGHATITMTQRYAHLSQPVMQSEAKYLNFDIQPKVKFDVI